MSGIRALYTALSNVDMVFVKEGGGNQAVTGLDLNEFKRFNKMHNADLPVRVLLPTDEYGAAGAGTSEPMNAGTAQSGLMMWNLIDLFLYKSTGKAGRGFGDVLPDLVRYSGDYVDTILGNDALVSDTQIYLQTVTPILGVFTFPVGGTEYYGVECQLTFMEHINPAG